MSEVSDFILHRVVIDSYENLRMDFTIVREIFLSAFKSYIVEVWQDDIWLCDYPHGKGWMFGIQVRKVNFQTALVFRAHFIYPLGVY